MNKAYLATADGLFFVGRSVGADGQAAGELCFNTSMTGYQEIITDPSYAGQIVTLTTPQIGNYGVNDDDAQSGAIVARGLVVREMCFESSNWRSTQSLPVYLRAQGIVAIDGIDTRKIVRHLRTAGAVNAVISTTCADRDALVAAAQAQPDLAGRDLVASLTPRDAYQWQDDAVVAATAAAAAVPPPLSSGDPNPSPNPDLAPAQNPTTPDPHYRVIAFDAGIKRDILRQLAAVGCAVTVVPPTTTAEEVLAANPDGVFLSNGPGDPAAVDYLYATVARLVGKVPLFGICLGHQMLALAAGGRTYKLKYGHRGGNHPVKNLRTGRVEITAQNHGFALDFASLATQGSVDGDLDAALAGNLEPLDSLLPCAHTAHFGRALLTHVNLNDRTVEGIYLPDVGAFSVQYHPEAAPGPADAHYLFEEFVHLMKEGTL